MNDQNAKQYKYAVHPNYTVTCLRNVTVISDRRIHAEENRETAWIPVIYSPAHRLFDRESDACRWAIDAMEDQLRALTRQMMSADDREADERAELEPNEP